MRILYASKRGYIPERLDGALYAAHSLLSLLGSRGHRCEAVAAIDRRYPARVRLYQTIRLLTARQLLGLTDRWNGYVTH